MQSLYFYNENHDITIRKTDRRHKNIFSSKEDNVHRQNIPESNSAVELPDCFIDQAWLTVLSKVLLVMLVKAASRLFDVYVFHEETILSPIWKCRAKRSSGSWSAVHEDTLLWWASTLRLLCRVTMRELARSDSACAHPAPLSSHSAHFLCLYACVFPNAFDIACVALGCCDGGTTIRCSQRSLKCNLQLVSSHPG